MQSLSIELSKSETQELLNGQKIKRTITSSKFGTDLLELSIYLTEGQMCIQCVDEEPDCTEQV